MVTVGLLLCLLLASLATKASAAMIDTSVYTVTEPCTWQDYEKKCLDRNLVPATPALPDDYELLLHALYTPSGFKAAKTRKPLPRPASGTAAAAGTKCMTAWVWSVARKPAYACLTVESESGAVSSLQLVEMKEHCSEKLERPALCQAKNKSVAAPISSVDKPVGSEVDDAILGDTDGIYLKSPYTHLSHTDDEESTDASSSGTAAGSTLLGAETEAGTPAKDTITYSVVNIFSGQRYLSLGTKTASECLPQMATDVDATSILMKKRLKGHGASSSSRESRPSTPVLDLRRLSLGNARVVYNDLGSPIVDLSSLSPTQPPAKERTASCVHCSEKVIVHNGQGREERKKQDLALSAIDVGSHESNTSSYSESNSLTSEESDADDVEEEEDDDGNDDIKAEESDEADTNSAQEEPQDGDEEDEFNGEKLDNINILEFVEGHYRGPTWEAVHLEPSDSPKSNAKVSRFDALLDADYLAGIDASLKSGSAQDETRHPAGNAQTADTDSILVFEPIHPENIVNVSLMRSDNDHAGDRDDDDSKVDELVVHVDLEKSTSSDQADLSGGQRRSEKTLRSSPSKREKRAKKMPTPKLSPAKERKGGSKLELGAPSKRKSVPERAHRPNEWRELSDSDSSSNTTDRGKAIIRLSNTTDRREAIVRLKSRNKPDTSPK